MSIAVCVLTGFGINADLELCEAFRLCGAEPQRTHVHDLIHNPTRLDAFRILAIPGGFSFGDHLGSGLVLASILKAGLKNAVERFIDDGKLIIGICNGFQVLVKMGVLPNLNGSWSPETSLVHNDTGLFEDSWIKVSFSADSHCIWTQGLDTMDLPIRHGEGRFYAGGKILESLHERHMIALTYNGRNPNGSVDAIAGITDRTGQILGLMPHPEAWIFPHHHPLWPRRNGSEGEGLKIFANGVRAMSVE